MSGEVGINKNEFDTRISVLTNAVPEIDGNDIETSEFEKTNIEPFIEDLETTIDAMELLERYKQMLDTDIKALENVGKEMVENDKDLSNISDPQSIRV